LLKHEDVSANAALVSGRWHESRQRHKDALIKMEGEERFAGLQQFFAADTALPVKGGFRESCTLSKNRLAKTFSAARICGRSSALLLQKNLHVPKVKGHRIGLEEIVANHAREMEAEHVLPWKRPVIKTLDVFFLYVSE